MLLHVGERNRYEGGGCIILQVAKIFSPASSLKKKNKQNGFDVR